MTWIETEQFDTIRLGALDSIKLRPDGAIVAIYTNPARDAVFIPARDAVFIPARDAVFILSPGYEEAEMVYTMLQGAIANKEPLFSVRASKADIDSRLEEQVVERIVKNFRPADAVDVDGIVKQYDEDEHDIPHWLR